VLAVERDFNVADGSDVYISFDVTGKDGQALYRFECASPKVASQRDLKFDYSGDFQCRLWSPADPRYSTLLTYDPNYDRDWMSRGRFFAEELEGACAKYPEFGKTRHFRLRGMSLTLAVSDVRFDRKTPTKDDPRHLGLRSFHLHVAVKPDSNAKSTIAGETSAIEPLSPDSEEPTPKAADCQHVRFKRLPGPVSQQDLQSLGLGAPFPDIAPTKSVLHIGLNSPQVVVIRSKSGSLLYRLQCDGIPNGFQSGLSGIECAFRRPGSKYDLLESSVDPFSLQKRSRISFDHVVGACRDHADWGAVRTFSLRGFRLVLKVTDLVPSIQHKGEYTESSLLVTATPDAHASSAVGLPSTYIDPSFLPLDRPGACQPIKIDP